MNIEAFKEKYYYISNIYTLNSYCKFEKVIEINLTSSDYLSLIKETLVDKFVIGNTYLTSLIVEVKEEVKDGYSLNINFKHQIIIKANNKRSLRYALEVLNDLVNEEDDVLILPVMLINDDAGFNERGIIEGYYGTPWTYENRMDMIAFMNENRLNTYMYAPKCDEYHRQKWFELYPLEELNKFINLNNKMQAFDIDFFYCISPGYHKENEIGFKYTDEEDFTRLFNKLDQLIKIGIKDFGLLLDDIDYVLKGENLERFKRPGIAHARVYRYLQSKITDVKMVMCPTEYHQIGRSPYRDDLAKEMDKGIKVFWTGDNVCAEVITDEQVKVTKTAFNHELLLWENFPVTDFTYGVRTFIAPLINRSVNLNNEIDGFYINPMIYYETSKVAMITEAHYAWNPQKYQSDKSFVYALNKISPAFYQAGYDFIMYNYPNVLTYGNQSYEEKLVNTMDKEAIITYHHLVKVSANKLLKLDLPIIKELEPWLTRTIKEDLIINKILNNTITKKELIKFLQIKKFTGSTLLDMLIDKFHLLNEDEYTSLIKKPRGNPWYRVWERKR